MRATKILLSFLLTCEACFGQITPNQAMQQAAAYQRASDQNLKIITAYFGLSLVGLGALTPSQALSQAGAFQALDDHSLNVITAWGVVNALPTSTNLLTVGPGAQYSTIKAALTNASAGNTIIVYPGTYTENNLLKSGVNYFFYPGTLITYTNTGFDLTSGYGFFDDRATGKTTNKIAGYGDFYYSVGTNLNNTCHGNTNVAGCVLTTTNPATDIYFEARACDGDAWPDCAGVLVNGVSSSPSLFWIAAATNCEVHTVELRNPAVLTSQNSIVDAVNLFYWETGSTYLFASHIGQSFSYGIWANTRVNTVQNLWVSFQLNESYTYITLSGPNNKMWIDCKEIRVTNGIAGGSTAISQFGGRVYVKAEKIGATGPNTGGGVIAMTGAGEQWTTAQKITSSAGNNWVQNAGGTNYLSVQQLEAPGGGIINSAGGITYFNPSVVSNAVAPFAITFPATTVNWTNLTGGTITLFIDNTGVTGTATKLNGTTIYASTVLDVQLTLKPNDYFSETYTLGTPTGKFIFQ